MHDTYTSHTYIPFGRPHYKRCGAQPHQTDASQNRRLKLLWSHACCVLARCDGCLLSLTRLLNCIRLWPRVLFHYFDVSTIVEDRVGVVRRVDFSFVVADVPNAQNAVFRFVDRFRNNHVHEKVGLLHHVMSSKIIVRRQNCPLCVVGWVCHRGNGHIKWTYTTTEDESNIGDGFCAKNIKSTVNFLCKTVSWTKASTHLMKRF